MKKRPIMALAIACVLLLSACSAPGGAGGAKTGTSTEAAPAAQSSSENEKSIAADKASTGPGETDTAGTSSADAYHKITAEEAKRMMDAGNVTVVDVRTQEEYDQGHVPGAILIPLQTIGDEMPAELPQKDATLIIYCRTGVRSKQASDRLIALGYTSIYDMGGIVDWTYETEIPEE